MSAKDAMFYCHVCSSHSPTIHIIILARVPPRLEQCTTHTTISGHLDVSSFPLSLLLFFSCCRDLQLNTGYFACGQDQLHCAVENVEVRYMSLQESKQHLSLGIDAGTY